MAGGTMQLYEKKVDCNLRAKEEENGFLCFIKT